MSVQMHEQDYTRSNINNNLSHTALSLVSYAVDKGLCGRNVPHELLLILLYMYLLTISTPDIDNVHSNEPLRHQDYTHISA